MLTGKGTCIILEDKEMGILSLGEIIFQKELQSISQNKINEVLLIVSKELLENVNVIKLNKKTKEEVLEDLSNIAIKAGYAKPGYRKAILEREEKYPTGLHTPQIEVAIPHADAEWANEPSLTIGLLENPVTFEPMGQELSLIHI